MKGFLELIKLNIYTVLYLHGITYLYTNGKAWLVTMPITKKRLFIRFLNSFCGYKQVVVSHCVKCFYMRFAAVGDALFVFNKLMSLKATFFFIS